MENIDQGTGNKSRFKQFESLATIIGFVVDLKELISTLLSLIIMISLLFSTRNNKEPATFPFTNVEITPFHALGLWLLALYIYLGYARSVWDKEREIKGYRDRFLSFIINDLLFGFKNIPLSVISVAFIFVFFWIVVEIIIFWPAIIILLFFLLFFGAIIIGPILATPTVNQEDVQSFKKDIDENWPKWDRFVQMRLEGYQWISTNSFTDIIKVWKISEDEIEYLLAKYASKHPKTVKYTRIQNSSDNSFYTTSNVLVQLKSLDRNKYTC